MSLDEDGQKSLMAISRENRSRVTLLSNHISDLEKRITRLEKLVLVAIATNIPQLIRIFLSL